MRILRTPRVKNVERAARAMRLRRWKELRSMAATVPLLISHVVNRALARETLLWPGQEP